MTGALAARPSPGSRELLNQPGGYRQKGCWHQGRYQRDWYQTWDQTWGAGAHPCRQQAFAANAAGSAVAQGAGQTVANSNANAQSGVGGAAANNQAAATGGGPAQATGGANAQSDAGPVQANNNVLAAGGGAAIGQGQANAQVGQLDWNTVHLISYGLDLDP